MMRLFSQYQFLQKRAFYHSIAFIVYRKTYLLSLFLDNLHEPFNLFLRIYHGSSDFDLY